MYSLLWPAAQLRELTVPLFSQSVRAGFPSPASDYVEAGLDFNELLVSDQSTTFVVRAEGESMLGAGIFPGDYLVVDRSLPPRPENVVIAALDGEFTVKRLKKAGERYLLVPENPAYPAVAVDENSELSIWGVVTFVIHSLKVPGRRS